MSFSRGVVLQKSEVLAELCGPNDYNLQIIERLIGSRVLFRGNELFVESQDEALCSLFTRIIDRLVEAVSEGMPVSPDLIYAVHADLTPEGSHSYITEFLESGIQIPGGYGKVLPLSQSQSRYIKSFALYDLVLVEGPAGTGKTYLAVAWALSELLSKRKRKLVLTRPVVEAGESLGFLPGDLAQKINPYLRPLYDAMEMLLPFEVARKLEESRSIEVAPLAYMRGRSLANCIVILDEAQNTTKEQMKMFLTRLGQGAKAIVTGDISQIDLQRKGDSGLVHALKILGNVKELFICRLDGSDVVRSPLVRRVIEAYEAE